MLQALRRSLVLQLFALALALTAAATVIGLVALWPDGSRAIDPVAENARAIERATVEAVAREECRVPGAIACARVTIRLGTGPDRGESAGFTVGETRSDVRLTVGDRIRVFRLDVPPGMQVFGREVDRYGFTDYERERPLAFLALAFCALVVAAGRCAASARSSGSA
ncbi:MAG TPA: hypothetical protein VMN35_05000 [Gaiellaceae bacterium]|nr:hypothetical protein [Gaiellaceae bacterium]